MGDIDCGGCGGLGGHSQRCPETPGWIWRRLADVAERIAHTTGATPEMQNTAWAAEAHCLQLAREVQG
ncbi:hypothetical protein [Gordonia sihwensis]|uniref:hypothetical protein n=1 Tax=Gordonia sihwensis TaxID=173559 RepID=UPI001C930EBF|nr:hypothetical protein [Gordonia sihwensis]